MRQIAIPDDLANRVEATGSEFGEFVIEAIEAKLSGWPVIRGRTLREMLDAGFVLPTIEGKQRDDGKAWSEIEAPCDPE